ncbi:hypothetical protein [Polaromonas sp. CG9_12]|nr:hypothetical protein [Polaromonas sp. CG9_12]
MAPIVQPWSEIAVKPIKAYSQRLLRLVFRRPAASGRFAPLNTERSTSSLAAPTHAAAGRAHSTNEQPHRAAHCLTPACSRR